VFPTLYVHDRTTVDPSPLCQIALSPPQQGTSQSDFRTSHKSKENGRLATTCRLRPQFRKVALHSHSPTARKLFFSFEEARISWNATRLALLARANREPETFRKGSKNSLRDELRIGG
jgi:hypothetical protein